MAIERVVLKRRLSGPGFSLKDVVVRELAGHYIGSEPVDELEELPHGVRITVRDRGTVKEVDFNVPWSSIEFSQGREKKKAPKP